MIRRVARITSAIGACLAYGASVAHAQHDSTALPTASLVRDSDPAIWSGGAELGRAAARVSGADSTLLVATTFAPSTVFSVDVTRRTARTQLMLQGGLAVATDAYGGYGRFVSVLMSGATVERRVGWMLSADATLVGATREGGSPSAGLSAYYGRSDILLAGLRIGRRWRSGVNTPVTTLDLSRTSTFTLGQAAGALDLSLTGTRTSFTGSRIVEPSVNTPLYYTELPYHMSVTLADAHVRPRLQRGAFGVEVDGLVRLGRSASVWDDPNPRAPEIVLHQDILAAAVPISVQRERNSRFGGLARVSYEIAPHFTIVGEGGRRLSDPLSGVAGSRYLSVSIRAAFDGAINRFARERGDSRARAGSSGNSTSTLNRRGDTSAAGVLVYRDGAADSTLALVVRGVAAQRVELAADFTEWRPVALEACGSQANGGSAEWCGRFTVPTGTHYLIIRTDGGAWRVAPGTTPVTDSYEGRVGLLLVP